ncbi:hypothetical protein I4U23_004612 [Adineta vaga]|nr:hypothetical protein I4U23_004612 [Adineta vaga]
MAHQQVSNHGAAIEAHSLSQTLTVTHNETVSQMLNEPEQSYETLILQLKSKQSEDGMTEKGRIIDEMKKDMSGNSDDILEHVIQARPPPESSNCERKIQLYNHSVDEMQKLMIDLDKTFAAILSEFSVAIDDLWETILNNDEKKLKEIQECFRKVLHEYNAIWNIAFKHTNEIMSNFKKELAQHE